MGWFSSIMGGAAKAPIQAVFDGIDALVTSDDERAAADLLKAKMLQKPQLMQAEISKIEAGHRSVFVAGWRPAIGWVCALGLLFPFIINPVLQWVTGEPGPDMPTEAINTLVFALLGLGTMRTIEKHNGRSK